MTGPARTAIIAAVVALLVAVVVVGGYAAYAPSRRDVLDGVLPASFGERIAVDGLPEPDRTRFRDALRAAVRGVLPGHRVLGERLYVHPGGYAWHAVDTLSGQRLRDGFGYRAYAGGRAEVDGQGVDYLLWRPASWAARIFDDRVVAAVGLATLLAPDYATLVFGYFALTPG